MQLNKNKHVFKLLIQALKSNEDYKRWFYLSNILLIHDEQLRFFKQAEFFRVSEKQTLWLVDEQCRPLTFSDKIISSVYTKKELVEMFNYCEGSCKFRIACEGRNTCKLFEKIEWRY